MGRIVVGVDGSDGAATALSWAVSEARIRGGTTVDALMAWHEPAVAGTLPMAVVVDVGDLQASYQAELDRIVDDVALANPDVTVAKRLVHGAPAGELLAAATDADLLVVGHRGRGGFLGLLMGSVSQYVATHAPCPVVVVPRPEV